MMPIRLAARLATVLAGAGGLLGCSLIVDPDRFSGAAGAAGDGGSSDDAEPGSLKVTRVTPGEVLEGQGAMPTAPAVAIVFTGFNFDDNTMVSSADSRVEIVGPTLASTDGTLLGTAVRVAIDKTLAHGVPVDVEITVTKGDESDVIGLTLRGLDELLIPAGDFEVAAATLRPRYSQIMVGGAASLRGSSAVVARLAATSDIVIGSALDARGGSGSDTPAGGCAGGDSAQPGMCATGGGHPGGESDIGFGGGGGGHSIQGIDGVGGGGGGGGEQVGDSMLALLGATGARGNGGGGGGEGGNGAGGAGGAGGGVVILDSEGALQIGAMVAATGGDGKPGAGTCPTSGGGGGGGGSGGAILLRAAGPLVVTTGAALDVRGGAGAPDCRAGGAGAPGRIRIDLPGAELPFGLGGASLAARGPMWAADASVVTRYRYYAIALLGGKQQTYGHTLNGGPIQVVATDLAGTASVIVDLEPGMNSLCALVRSDLTSFTTESQTCRAIVYLP